MKLKPEIIEIIEDVTEKVLKQNNYNTVEKLNNIKDGLIDIKDYYINKSEKLYLCNLISDELKPLNLYFKSKTILRYIVEDIMERAINIGYSIFAFDVYYIININDIIKTTHPNKIRKDMRILIFDIIINKIEDIIIKYEIK